MKLWDLVGSLLYLIYFQGTQTVRCGYFMIRVYFSSTCAHIKFDISLYNEQNTYYLRPIIMPSTCAWDISR